MSNFDIVSSYNDKSIVYNQINALESSNDQLPVISNNYYWLTHRQQLPALTAFVKLHSLLRVNNAIDASVVDRIENELRFNVYYHIQSTTVNVKFTFWTWASETKPILSLTNLFPAFNWAEREIWDMFGLFIIKHPDLRRILTDYGFIGHPLCKDFPLSGFKETHFEDSIKHVETINTELSQAFKLHFINKPWSNK